MKGNETKGIMGKESHEKKNLCRKILKDFTNNAPAVF